MEENKRDQTSFGLAMILCGALVSIPSLILGGSLVAGMSLPVAILTGLAGYSFIVLMMVSQGMQSVDQGKPAVVVAQQVFGKAGSSKVISIIIAIAALGWFGIQANVGGLAVANLLTYLGLPIPAWLASLLTGLLMVVTAMYGVKLIRLLAYVAVPYLIIVILYGLWFAFAKQDAAATIAAYHPSGTLSCVNGFSSTVGSFAMAGVIVGDYAQFSKRRADVVKAAVFGVIPAGVLMIAVGAILTIAFKSTDISSLFMKIGSPVIGGLALILGTWKVNVVNAYSGGIAVANIFNIPEKYRKLTLFLVGLGGIVLSIVGILNYFEPVMTIFSAMIPPVAGAMAASYWAIHHGQLNAWQPVAGVNWLGLSAWALGAVVGVLPVLVPAVPNIPVLGIIIAFVVYYAGAKVHPEWDKVSELN
ncbi:cytosine permease [Lacticaseibacillus paracasei subsp. tolerans]|nr:cytosine permease [Lacticaseibacillus paracasei]GEL37186.1 cytosine permease [Lacticaseibacillus paracasei subsp. tolerans]